ncbi:unnamed protein product [Vitrella brassicaformis CCMP3155]|uniref:Chitin-binding type-2 domain-containing protein n=4 Tax=Vitrella brassicaformis TaxID=1169539 RepID=A0A0G4GY96_VITBC|nr:unnamed protein product [Vitrella brassicaformis CCMP3155]|eukprot:CEM36103.1 unnamed protein product [Vitrella brassicaformis CCMP3155]
MRGAPLVFLLWFLLACLVKWVDTAGPQAEDQVIKYVVASRDFDIVLRRAAGSATFNNNDCITIVASTTVCGDTGSGTGPISPDSGSSSATQQTYSSRSIPTTGTYRVCWCSDAASGPCDTTDGKYAEAYYTLEVTNLTSHEVVMTQQPQDAAAGAIITDPSFNPVQVEVHTGGAIDPAYAGNVYVALNPPTGGLSGTVAVDATGMGGIVDFTDLSVQVAGTYTLTFTCDECLGVASAEFDIDPLPAAALIVTTQPPASAVAGALLPSIIVTAVDGLGNKVATYTDPIGGPIVASIAAGSGTCGAAFLPSSTDSEPAVNGDADFDDLRIDFAGSNYVLNFTDGTLTVTSDPFDITPGSCSQIELSTEPPSTVQAEEEFGVQVVMKDANDNTVSGSNAVGLSITGGLAILSGPTDVFSDATTGVATFNHLSIDRSGSFSIEANAGSCAGGSGATATSAVIAVTGGPQVVLSGCPVIKENGPPGFYSVVLNSRPNSDVTINIAGLGLTVDPTSLVFTPVDYNKHQYVNVTADSDGSFTITHAIGSAPDAWNPPSWSPSSDVQVTVLDDDLKYVIVSGDGWVVEGQSQTAFTIVLDSEPSLDTTVTLASANGHVTFVPAAASFTFTSGPSGDWATPKPVVIAGVTDDISYVGGARIDEITFAITGGGDPSFGDLSNANHYPDPFEVSVFDDVVPGVTWTPNHIVAFQGGTAVTTTVRLTTAPENDVTIQLDCSPTNYVTPSGPDTIDAFPSPEWTNGVPFTLTPSTATEPPDTVLSYTVKCQASITSVTDDVYRSPPNGLPEGSPGSVSITLYRRACADGTFAHDCLPCLPGSECTNNTMTPCSIGTYADLPTAPDSTCQACPAGSECPDPSFAPVACLAGEYSLGSETYCTPCPAGSRCPNLDGSGIVQCPNGQYSDYRSTACNPCTAGFFCNNTGSGSAFQLECPLGSYSLLNSETCIPCPAGSQCPTPDIATPEDCTALAVYAPLTGFYALEGSTACTMCPWGVACNDTGPTEVCPLGTYSPPGEASCITCPAGSYCPDPAFDPIPCENLQSYSHPGQTECTPCPAGYECPDPIASGTSPLVCAEGEYSYEGEGVCTPCAPGYVCQQGSTSPRPAAYACPKGSYCPAGTTEADLLTISPAQCPRGAGEIGDCQQCVAGYYCNAGQSVPDANVCPAGSYCPPGTQASAIPVCPQGTYNDEIGSVSVYDCKPCPAGTYCDTPGRTAPVLCPPGYWCAYASLDYTSTPCPRGTYSDAEGLEHPEDCTDCPPGSYCPLSSTVPTPCPPGTWNDQDKVGFLESCQLCTEGFSCPHYGQSALPSLSCPQGTEHPDAYPCPPGTYGDPLALNQEKAADCTDCPGGSYCHGGDTAESGPCPMGYYCPQGTTYATEYPCPAGTYNDQTGQSAFSDCEECTATNYCPEAAEAETKCPEGSYSNDTNFEARGPGLAFPFCIICPAGYSCTNGNFTDCLEGEYSSEGKNACTPCPKGHYCDATATTEVQMLANECPAGFFCAEDGIDTVPAQTPVDRRCTRGHYCPRGSIDPTPCPAGTYNDDYQKEALSDCKAMPAGRYSQAATIASNEGSPKTGECAAGYFCPEGSFSSTQEPCPPGTFRNAPAATSAQDCASCPAGSFCNLASTDHEACPYGYWCPDGTDNPSPCEPGTFGDTMGLTQASDCTNCTEGMYCDHYGLTAPKGDCDPGFYCAGRAVSPAPRDNITGNICSVGGFCPAGSSEPTACSEGFYNPFEGAKDNSSCITCPPGFYCDGVGAATASQPCEEGFYCPGGAIDPYGKTPTNSTNMTADEGYYAPAGSSNQVPCPIGTYNDLTGQGSCTTCPAGYYCPDQGMSDVVGYECPQGSFCQVGSTSYQPCPPGTYGNASQLSTATDCTPCDDGTACEQYGMNETGRSCSAGYFCVASINLGSAEVAPQTTTATGGPCPAGFYCENGTSVPDPCPIGTFNPSERGVDSSSCLPCTPGRFCNETNQTDAVHLCGEGYYCPAGTNESSPAAYECTAGYKCPAGSAFPIPCEEGTYQDTAGMGFCNDCPGGGKYCPLASIDPLDCPAGHFCPNKTASATQFPCPPGTYNNLTSQETWHSCIECDPGKYCALRGLEEPTGDCAEGFYCTGASVDPNPVLPRTDYAVEVPGEDITPCGSGVTYGTQGGAETYCNLDSNCIGIVVSGPTAWSPRCGSLSLTSDWVGRDVDISNSEALPYFLRKIRGGGGRCTPGHICPGGSSSETPCPDGSYCGAHGLAAPTGDCHAGYFCNQNASDPTKYKTQESKLCGPGTWCPENALSVEECLEGEFNPARGNENATDCLPCTPGFYCDSTGLAEPTGPCNAGHFCGPNSTSATENTCPAGTFCAVQSYEAVPCEPGTYQTASGSSTCDPCEAGSYCDRGADSLTPCPPGFYCPANTEYDNQYPCPVGTFNTSGSAESSADCTDCDPGYYCEVPGKTDVTGPCDAGYFCPPNSPSQSITPRPLNNYCGFGEYCLQSSSLPTDCPEGQYCGQQRLPAPSGYCHAGHICTNRSSSAAPLIDMSSACPPEESPEGSLSPRGHYSMSAATIRTVAGGGGGTTDGTFATAFQLSSPEDAVEDGDGNMYIADTGSHRILYVEKASGKIQRVVGTGTAGYGSAGPGTSFELNTPSRLAIDVANSVLFISDSANNRTVKYDITTGSASDFYVSADYDDDYPGNDFLNPQGMHFDNVTNRIYLANTGRHEVVWLDAAAPGNTVTRVTGTYDSAGDTDSGVGEMDTPMDVTMDSSGDLYIADKGNHKVRFWDGTNLITFMGDGTSGTTGDDTTDPTTARLEGPSAVVFAKLDGATEALFILDETAHRIRKVELSSVPANAISTWAGTDQGFKGDGGAVPANEAKLKTPRGLQPAYRKPTQYYALSDNVWHFLVADTLNSRIRQIIVSPPDRGQAANQMCPPGTFMPWEGNIAEQDCLLCPAGLYCPEEGMAVPGGPCANGTYCSEGGISASGDVCPQGHFCAQQVDPGSNLMQTHRVAEDGSGSNPSNAVDTDLDSYWEDVSTFGYLEVTLDDYYVLESFDVKTWDVAKTYQGGALEDFSIQFYNYSTQAWEDLVAPYNYPSGNHEISENISPPRIANVVRLEITSIHSSATPPPALGNAIRIFDFKLWGSKTIGAPAAIPCPIGTYQPSTTGESECVICPAGSYCAGGVNDDMSTRIEDCPSGHYCPEGTQWETQYPCPPGTFSNAVKNEELTDCEPCSAGKYCDRPGLTEPTGNCSAGYYCTTGNFLPAPRSGEENPNKLAENITVIGGLCPRGAYCLEGTENGTDYLCPAGSFTQSAGSPELASCQLCDAGYYCASTVSPVRDPCDGGYVCLSGSDNKDPDGLEATCPNGDPCMGYPCPAGYYCPQGAVAEQACAPGNYSGPGVEECDLCPATKYCPNSAMTDTDTTNGTYDCPVGRYCPEGTVWPLPPPPGYYVDAPLQDKPVPCNDGHYCPGYGNEDGNLYNCSAGFACKQAPCSSWPDNCPHGGRFQYEVDQIFNDTEGRYAGRCPAGHYCPEATADPIECPTGTFQPATTSSECEPCTPGKACTAMGLSAPDADCDAGYYCSGGATRSDPSSPDEGGECPPGHYCPTASETPIPCEPGKFSNDTGADACMECTAGFRCPNQTVTPEPCPDGRVCPAGSAFGIGCPEGSYLNDSLPTLPDDIDEDCSPCEPAQYCRAGRIVGNCSVRDPYRYSCLTVPDDCVWYICGFGNAHPNPREDKGNNNPYVPQTTVTWEMLSKSNFDQLAGGGPYGPVFGGIQCPEGYFCPEGTREPIECKDGAVRLYPGGRFETDCTACPERYYCPPGVSPPVPIECPAGHYCPTNTRDPIPCPVSLYNNFTQKASLRACIPCPAGVWCTEMGTSYPYNETQGAIPCPEGSYCLEGTIMPIPCPPGTFVNTTGSTNALDCFDCPGGFYCASSNSTTPDSPCPAGTYCPPRSALPRQCPGGFYCPNQTTLPIVCPPGYACPNGTAELLDPLTLMTMTMSVQPTRGVADICPLGTYCPEGSETPRPCPPGYRGWNKTFDPSDPDSLRTTLEESCLPCEPGSFQEGNDVFCQPCEPGYVCLEGCNRRFPTIEREHNGYECPEGSYCPEGSSAPTRCAAGTYQNKIRALTADECKDCPISTFNPSKGQPRCLPCGASAKTTITGATICECIGANRAFQASDQSCICAPGFEFFHEDTIPLSEEDGRADCQEYVYERCQPGERRNVDGNCIAPDCDSECKLGGQFLDSVGLCSCRVLTFSEQLCDLDCRAGQMLGNIAFLLNNNLEPIQSLVVINQTDNTFCNIPVEHLTGRTEVLLGVPTCSEEARQLGNCNLRYESTTSDGVLEGNFGFPLVLLKVVMDRLYNATPADCFNGTVDPLNDPPLLEQYNSSVSRRRRLQATVSRDPAETPGVTNPVMCLEFGESMVWSLSADRNGNIAYPVYVKDALLNTNPTFDFAPFKQLETDIKAGVSRAMFAYTFDAAGVYVFALSSDNKQRTIISVMGTDERCREDSRLPQTITATALTSVGVSVKEDIQLTPDWWLLLGTIAAITGTIFLVIAGLWWFRSSTWTEDVGPLGPEADYRRRLMRRNIFDIIRAKKADVEYDQKDLRVNLFEAGAGKKDFLSMDEDVDPRIFQAVYDKLLSHHSYVSQKFADQLEQQKEETEAILREALNIRDELLLKLSDALDKQDDADSDAIRHRQRLEVLMGHLYRKRDALIDAWKGLYTEAKEMGALERFRAARERERRGSLESVRSVQSPSALKRQHANAALAQKQKGQLAIEAMASARTAEALRGLMGRLATCENDAERKAMIEQFEEQMKGLQIELNEAQNQELDELKRKYEEQENKLMDARQQLQMAQQKQTSAEQKLAVDRAALNARQDGDREALAQDGAAEQNKLLADYSKKCDKAHANFQEQLERELVSAGSPEEREEIIQRNLQQYNAVLEGLEQERISQEKALQEKLAKRRDALKKRQMEEQQKLATQQQQQLDAAAKDLNEARATELKMSQEDETETFKQQNENTREQKQSELLKRYESKAELKKAQLEAELEKKLRGAKSEEERQQIIKEHDRQVKKALDLLDEERSAAQAALDKKLQERERRRAEAMKKRHAAEEAFRAKEEEQKAEWRKLEADQESDRNKAMRDLSFQRAEKEKAVKDETAQKLFDLMKEFNEKRAALQSIEDPEERKRQEDQLNSWLDTQRSTLLQQEAAKLDKIDAEHRKAETDTWNALRKKHADQRDGLQKKHQAEREKDAANLNKLRAEEARAMEASDEAAMMDDLEVEESAAKEKLERDTINAKNEMLSVARRRMQQQLADLGDATDPETDAQREQIREAYQREVAHLEALLDKEKGKQMTELDKKLEQRRAERLEKAKAARELDEKRRDLEKKQGEDRQLLELQQVAEKLMEAEAAAQEAQGEAHEMRAMHQGIAREARERMLAVALDPTAEADEKENLLAQFQENEERMVESLNAERMVQEQGLKDKMAARRARLAARQVDEAVKQDQTHENAVRELQAEEQVAVMTGAADAALAVARALATATKEEMAVQHAEELAAVQQEQEEALRELKAEMEREVQAARAAVQREVAMEQKKKQQKMEEEKKKLRQEAEQKAAKAATQDAKKRIMQDLAVQMDKIDTAINEEAQKQDVALEAKLAARKKRLKAKEQAMRREHEKQLEEQKLEQMKQQIEAQSAAERRAEAETLKQMAQAQAAEEEGEAAAPPTEMVKQVLYQRHEREANDMLSLHFRQKAIKLAHALDELNKERDQGLADIMAKCPKTYDETPATAKKRQAEIAELEKQHKAKCDTTLAKVTREVDESQEEEMMALKERHVQELTDAFGEISHVERYVKAQEERDLVDRAKLEEFQRKKEEEIHQRMRLMEEEWAQREALEKQKLERELQDFEEKLEAQAQKDREAAEQRATRLRDKVLQEQEVLRKKKMDLAKSDNKDDDEKKAEILRQFEEEQQQLVASLDAERDRQVKSLEERLQAKKKAQKERQMKRSEEEQRKFKEKQAQRLEKQRKLLEKTGQQELKQKEAELMMQGAQRRAIGAEEGMEGEVSPLWDEILNEEEVAGTLFLPSETSTEAEGQRGGAFVSRLFDIERLLREEGSFLRDLLRSVRKLNIVLQQLDNFPGAGASGLEAQMSFANRRQSFAVGGSAMNRRPSAVLS